MADPSDAPVEPSAATPAPPDRRFGWWVAGWTVVGLAVRLIYAAGWRFDHGLVYDAPVYRARATFLLDGHRFLDPDAWLFHQKAAEGAVHPPGNALVLAAGQLLGLDSGRQTQVWAAIVGTGLVVAVALLGRAVAGRRVGIIAAALTAIHPGAWSYAPLAMAEAPGQVLTALVLLAAYRYWDSPDPVRAAWLGGAAAAAALVRSELVLMIPILVLPLIASSRGTGRQIAVRLGAAVLWVAMVLGPWVGWNAVRFEHPVTLASGIDVSLVYAQCDDTWYGPYTGYWNVFCGAEITNAPVNRWADESELGRQYRARAGQYIASHRERWPAVIGARVGRTLSIYRPVQQLRLEEEREGREGPVLVANLVATAACAALAVVAFARPPRSRRHLLPLLAPLAAGVAGAAITFGTTRYRAPGEVGLIVLAAIGIEVLHGARRRRRDEEPGTTVLAELGGEMAPPHEGERP